MVTILFRKEFDDGSEMNIAQKYFDVRNYRTHIPKNSLVIGRYSCLPYYQELEEDLKTCNSYLINSFKQHKYVANFEYYEDIKDYTFETWFSLQDIPTEMKDKPLIVKGRTNSKKFQWNTHMFANNFKEAVHIYSELMNDSFIGSQGVIVRAYHPLETFEIGINDIPMTNEWRLFFYKNRLLSFGYYWSMIDDLSYIEKAKADFMEKGLPFAQQVANIIKEKVNFFVIDIAKTQEGDWIVIEVNDGQQSGLNEFNDPHSLYGNLQTHLDSEN